jgi:predicted metal-binding protein
MRLDESPRRHSPESSQALSSGKLVPGEVVLLDTSAFRSLSKEELAQALSRGLKLSASPYCFWELLCHLDEGEDFARAKGRLMKFRGVKIVDKPLDRVAAQSESSCEARIWSSDLVYAALAAIESASSVDHLNRSLIVNETGNKSALDGCVSRIKGILGEKQNKFREFMSELIGLITSGGVNTDTPMERHAAILSLVTCGGTPLPDTADLDYEADANEDQIVAFSYIYWGYALHRAIQLADGGGTTCAKNDFEDGQLCAYVPLDKSMIVVSRDTRLLEMLAAVRDVLIKVDLGKRACYALAGPGFLSKGGGGC